MRRRRGESGQMAVELAVVLPVILFVLIVAVDCMVFVGECARFDHLASQTALALAASPGKDGYGAEERVEAVRARVAEAFEGQGAQVTVKSRDAGILLSGAVVYEFELAMAPWPFDGAGAGAPAMLRHRHCLAFDPYTPGEL